MRNGDELFATEARYVADIQCNCSALVNIGEHYNETLCTLPSQCNVYSIVVEIVRNGDEIFAEERQDQCRCDMLLMTQSALMSCCHAGKHCIFYDNRAKECCTD